jgi:NADH-quinone oxidoreductase subunit J
VGGAGSESGATARPNGHKALGYAGLQSWGVAPVTEWIFFIVVGLVAVAAATGVVAQRNVLYSGLLLIVNCLCLATLYILMGAEFVGVVQIIVYAGAVMVLFLLTLMLVGDRPIEARSGRLPRQKVLAALLIAVLAGQLGLLVAGGVEPGALAGRRLIGPEAGLANVQAIAYVLFTRYVWALQATALLLLVALVGVVYLIKGDPGQGARR